MPSEKENRQQAPDTARSYERADPAEEKGQGEMGEVRNTPIANPADVQGSVQNGRIRMPMTADDIVDASATADPAAPSGKTDAQPRNAIPAAGTQPGKNAKYIEPEVENHA
ncbi:MAG: hypothetical protein AAGD32_05680 [Planctomycetota bacterium]